MRARNVQSYMGRNIGRVEEASSPSGNIELTELTEVERQREREKCGGRICGVQVRKGVR